MFPEDAGEGLGERSRDICGEESDWRRARFSLRKERQWSWKEPPSERSREAAPLPRSMESLGGWKKMSKAVGSGDGGVCLTRAA